MVDKCPICKNPISPITFGANISKTVVACEICGQFRLTEPLWTEIQNRDIPDYHIYSAILREHSDRGKVYFGESLDNIRYSASIPNGPLEQIDKLLLAAERHTTKLTSTLRFVKNDYPLAYVKNFDDFVYLTNYLDQIGYTQFYSVGSSQANFRLSMLAWKRISELHQTEIKSDQAFVAMNFHESTDAAWEQGIKPALEETGYQPLRIDQTEHNNKIDDEIIAGIRKSGLMIADFTNHRPNVYYEAGFALGLGIPVIWTCHKDQIEQAHFDTRQYSYIEWDTPEELKQKLINRIEATISKPRK